VEPVPAELDAASGVVKDVGAQSAAAGWVSSLRARFKRWVLGDRVRPWCRWHWAFYVQLRGNTAVAAVALCVRTYSRQDLYRLTGPGDVYIASRLEPRFPSLKRWVWRAALRWQPVAGAGLTLVNCLSAPLPAFAQPA